MISGACEKVLLRAAFLPLGWRSKALKQGNILCNKLRGNVLPMLTVGSRYYSFITARFYRKNQPLRCCGAANSDIRNSVQGCYTGEARISILKNCRPSACSRTAKRRPVPAEYFRIAVFSRIYLQNYHKRLMIIIEMKAVPKTISDYFASIGRKGGSKSRRRLSSEQAKNMVRVREARKAYKKYHAQCFWYMSENAKITQSDIPEIVRGLKKNGGRRGFILAAALCR